jgi:ABC-2 type transport system ATP-binding protein
MAVLEVTGVTKQYRRGPLVNDDISLVVEAGEVFGLLGPNGAGKTTLIGQIIGLVEPQVGRSRSTASTWWPSRRWPGRRARTSRS